MRTVFRSAFNWSANFAETLNCCASARCLKPRKIFSAGGRAWPAEQRCGGQHTALLMRLAANTESGFERLHWHLAHRAPGRWWRAPPVGAGARGDRSRNIRIVRRWRTFVELAAVL